MASASTRQHRGPWGGRLLSLLAAVVAVVGFAAAGLVSTASAASPAISASHVHSDRTTGALPGYWMVATDGGIFNFGNAGYFGSASSMPLNQPIVGLAATPDGQGYWEVASDGGIFNYGDAGFFGSAASMPLNKPIVGIAATPDGQGYWEIASDGGIFNYGDAGFFGSAASMPLNQPIVGIAATPDGQGYWEIASDGGIFNYGDAGYFGSAGSIHLNKPIVGIATTPDGGGYWEIASDGGIFNYGDAVFQGSMGGVPLNKPIVGIAATEDGGGYWEAASDGGIFGFGDATFQGSTGGISLNKPVVGIAADPSSLVKISSTNLTGVSCPQANWCMAVDGAGNVVHYNGTSWGPAQLVDTAADGEFDGVSCPTTTFCMAVSYEHGYTIYSNGSWSPLKTNNPAITSNDYHAVSCSSATFCAVESDNFGDLAFYKSGVWEQPGDNGVPDPGGHNGIGIGQGSTPISCAGTHCMYVNNYGQAQTSVNGGSLSAAIDIPGQTNALESSVSCTSSTFCVAVNSGAYTAATWNGSTFTESAPFASSANINLGVNGISCVGSACTAIDDSNAYYSPAGGVGWSNPEPIDNVAELTAISCASTSFCAAVDYGGYAVTINPSIP